MRNPGQIVGFLCDSASVLEGAVLVQGASNDTVALPSAANSTEKFIGLAYQDGSATANEAVSVVLNGIFAARAAGTITRGDRLVIAGATGTVQAASLTTPANATVIGIALGSAVNGERVAVLIGAVAQSLANFRAFTASGSITANTIVVAAAAGAASAPGGADPTEGVLGVALNTVTNGQTVYVALAGSIANVTDSGAGVTYGDNIAVAGVGGTGKTAAPSAGTNSMCIGTALATTTASGSIPVLVQPFMFQG